jgi:hypothetical protein
MQFQTDPYRTERTSGLGDTVSIGGLDEPLGPNAIAARAGEEIRTPDVQLGKLAFYH